jgi:cytidyltransferase-like protein
MKKKVIIVSGYFNPLHIGHIEYFHAAKEMGDLLFVIVNNDIQRALKGSKEFMNEKDRLLILSELKVIDKAFISIDKDRTVINSIKKIYDEYSDNYKLFFANGGDQSNQSIPESKICAELDIKLLDGLGDKIQSSSWILKKYEN